MASIDAGEVEEAKKGITVVNSESRKSAVRILGKWEIATSDENIKLYLALRSLCKAKGSNVTQGMMSRHNQTEEAYTDGSYVEKYWCVVKAKNPDIMNDPEVRSLTIDTSVLAPLPGGIPKDEVWLVDAKCSHKFSPGTGKVRYQTGGRASLLFQAGVPEGSQIENREDSAPKGAPAEAAAGAPAKTGPGGGRDKEEAASPRPAKRSCVRTVPSDPDGEDWAARCGRAAVEAVQARRWYNPDPNRPDSLHFWVKEMAEYVVSSLETDPQADFPQHVPRFFEYTTFQVMSHETLDVSCFFTSEYDRVKTARVSLLHPCTLCLIVLAKCEPLAEPDLSAAGHAWKGRFVQCVLYKQWLGRRAQAQFTDLQLRFSKHFAGGDADAEGKEAHDAQTKALKAELVAQIASDPPAVYKDQLMVIQTLFCTAASAVDRVIFLLKDECRFEVLRAWSPRDGRLVFESFAKEPFKMPAHDIYLKTCRALVKGPLAQNVQSSVLKSLLSDFSDMKLAVNAETFQDEEDKAAFTRVVDAIFMELSTRKIKPTTAIPEEVFKATIPEKWPEQLVKNLHKVALSSFRKYQTESLAGGALSGLAGQVAEKCSAPVAAVSGPACATSQASTPTVPAADGAPAKAAAAEKGEQVGEKKPFQVGDVVRTSFGAHKEKFDGMKGIVKRLLAATAVVELQEGPAKGTPYKNFPYKNLSLWDSAPTTVPPAGEKASSSDKADTIFGPQETTSGSDKADNIFGKQETANP
jgi:hypothetical protein